MSKIKQITIYECLYLKDSISLFPTNACSDHTRLVMRMALTVYLASMSNILCFPSRTFFL